MEILIHYSVLCALGVLSYTYILPSPIMCEVNGKKIKKKKFQTTGIVGSFKVSRAVLVARHVTRPTLLGLGLHSDVSESVSMTQNKTISRPTDVAYIIKIKYFFELIIMDMFGKAKF